MAVNNKVFTLNSGTVSIGDTDFSAEFSKCVVTTSVNEGEPRVMVNGDVVEGGTTYAHRFKGTVEQNLTVKGFAGYAMANRGKIVPLVFTPHSTDGAKVEGNVRLDPVDIGGDGGAINTSDVDLAFIGDPKFTPAAKVNGIA